MSTQRVAEDLARAATPGDFITLGGPSASVVETAAHCARLMASAGPIAALRFLNARTRFRFTGIYRAEPPLLRNVYLFDRENPTLNVSGEVCPLEEAYCAIVAGDARPFRTRNAPRDDRLASHPARDRVISYCGVPIRSASGAVRGTLCHFDVRPRLLPHAEFDVLEAVGSAMTPWPDDPMA